jgi:hypothetical protein
VSITRSIKVLKIIICALAVIGGSCALLPGAAQAATIHNADLVTADVWTKTNQHFDGERFTIETGGSSAYAYTSAEAKLEMGESVQLHYSVSIPEHSNASATLLNRTTGSILYLYRIETDDFRLNWVDKLSTLIVPQDGDYFLQFWLSGARNYDNEPLWSQGWFAGKIVPEPPTGFLAMMAMIGFGLGTTIWLIISKGRSA